MILLAPFSGWSASLDEAPDEVFAGAMLGDGVVIDPTEDVLHAPCAGEIVAIPESRHAVTLRGEGGVEVLLHVGIDTVALAGEGFEPIVEVGEKVQAGAPLLRFDLDLIARRAKSLLTPVIVLDAARLGGLLRRQIGAVRRGDVLLELATGAATVEHASTLAAPITRCVRVAFEHGIHARPAALLVNRARTFAAESSLQLEGRIANARSVVALMSLGARQGDEVIVSAAGRDAAAAANALATLLGQGEGRLREPERTPQRPRPVQQEPDARQLRGVIASSGIAVGPAVRLLRPKPKVDEAGRGTAHESAALDAALETVRTRLAGEAAQSGTHGSILAAHLELLQDPELLSAARAGIAKGRSAACAWSDATRRCAQALAALPDARMAERRDDLLDIESRVLFALTGEGPAPLPALPGDAVVLAENLLPSQFVELARRHIAGICLAQGGATSHVALLAAAMDVPMVVAAGAAVLCVPDGAMIVLDAEHGSLDVAPDPAAIEAARAAVAARVRQRSRTRAAAQEEARTRDGERIEVRANVGSLAEAEAAVENGADGCGLLRTEFLFIDRQSPPDEAEQVREYQRIADAFRGRPVVVRTLDAGGDKPLACLPLPREDNPALGLRGLRAGLWRPDLLRVQLQALRQVAARCDVRVLLPMVVSGAEVMAVRGLLAGATDTTGRPRLRIGAMIETPAAAITADSILEAADFVSIGTNDLAQYTLAMDRGHPELAARLDALEPAVLRLVAFAAKEGVARGAPVAVCGGLAADPLAVPILIGLGVRELSVVPSAVPRIKALVRTLALDACRAMAAKALEQPHAEAVRALVSRNTTETTV